MDHPEFDSGGPDEAFGRTKGPVGGIAVSRTEPLGRFWVRILAAPVENLERMSTMTDNLSTATRSKVMASIRSQNTEPEIIVRRLLWASGKRYRIHDRSIPGSPDISNKRKQVAVFIDGCFWHGCPTCYREPGTNVAYWRNKIVQNGKRRRGVLRELGRGEWVVFQFWEHEIKERAPAIALSIGKKL